MNTDNLLEQQKNKAIEKLNLQMIEEIGEPSIVNNIYSNLKILFDCFLFYMNNQPEVYSFTFDLNMSIKMYMIEKSEYIITQAYAIYNINNDNFFKYLTEYINDKTIPDVIKNDEEIIAKKMNEKNINRTQNIQEVLENMLLYDDIEHKCKIQEYEKNSNGKKQGTRFSKIKNGKSYIMNK